jgi:hypothetical protein
MERLIREMRIEVAKSPTEKAEMRAYFRGLDRARKEVAIVAAIVALVIVAFRVMAA